MSAIRQVLDGINELPPLFRSLLVDLDFPIKQLATCDLVSLGDNITNLLALIAANIYINRRGSMLSPDERMDQIIKELLIEDRGVHIGVCLTIHQSVARIESLKDSLPGSDINERLLIAWSEARKRALTAQRGKTTISVRSSLSELIAQLLERAKCLYEFDRVDDLGWVCKSSNSRIPLFPFILCTNISNSGDRCLYAYDRYVSNLDAFQFVSWGKYETIRINMETSPNSIPLQKLVELLNKESQGETFQPSYMPLFAGSYPAMNRLVDLLWEHTTPETKEAMWHSQGKTEEEIRNEILLDCVERNPLEVLREVGRKEGLAELPGYVRQLSKGRRTKEEIEDRIQFLNQRWKAIAAERGTNAAEDDTLRDQVFSLEVAQLLGFPVRDIGDFVNLEHYIERLKPRLRQAQDSTSHDQRASLIRDSFVDFERIFREMVVFYDFVYFKYIVDQDNKAQWSEIRAEIEDFPLGRLHARFRELNQLFTKASASTINRLWGDSGICCYDRYKQIIREGHKKGDLLGLRNKIIHPREKENQTEEDPCETAQGCVQSLQWILRAMEFFADSRCRVYPYKLTFTLSSRTHQGIQTCRYVTDLTDLAGTISEQDDRQSNTKIYTDTSIDFAKVYYCLPNRRRSIHNIWVDPLLVPIDDVLD